MSLDKELIFAGKTFFVALAVAYLATPLARALSVRLKILDLPNRRKIHKSATPLLGGLAIYAGVILALFFTVRGTRLLLPLISAGTIIMAVGFINDAKGLSSNFRLICQTVCALLLIITGSRIDFLPRGLWGDAAEVLITLVWVVGITNAFNYLDGMDGLAAGSAALNAFCYAFILYSTGQYYLMAFAVAVMAASLGFLPYNFRQEKIFLGDAGSTFLGFILAAIALEGNWAKDNIVKISIPVLIMGVPIFDMVFTTILRIRKGKVRSVSEWLSYAAKDHFHHYLVDLGLSTKGAVTFIFLITFSLGISAIIVGGGRPLNAFLSLVQATITFCVLGVLIVVGKKRESGWSKP